MVLIGLLKNPETYMGNIISSYLNKILVQYTQLHNIDLIDIYISEDSSGNNVFQKDNIHINQPGHYFLYEKIVDFLLEIGMNN